VAGLGLAGWAALWLRRGLSPLPYPNEHAQLRADGPFALIRHPIYTGLLVACGAGAAASGNRRQVVVFVLLSALFRVKSSVEERALRDRFTGYDDYAAATRRFLPRLRIR